MSSRILQRSRRARILIATGTALALSALVASPAISESGIPRTDRPAAAEVYFITPADGEVVESPVVVRFGLREMGVAPAGVQKEGTGHHHLIVDADLPALDLPVPKSDHYLHFGKGQTEVSLDLEPGSHTLQLLVGDHNHVPHDPAVTSKRITITVEK